MGNRKSDILKIFTEYPECEQVVECEMVEGGVGGVQQVLED
jgi:hypothetical protein